MDFGRELNIYRVVVRDSVVDEVCELVEGDVGIDLDNIPGGSKLWSAWKLFPLSNGEEDIDNNEGRRKEAFWRTPFAVLDNERE